ARRGVARPSLDARLLVAGARPELPAAVRLERGGGEGVRDRARVPRLRRRGATYGVSRRRGRYGARRMAVRNVRGAGLRRAARGRAGFVALACALYLAAGISATWPAVQHARTHFL